MRKSIGRSVGAFFGLGLLLAACSGATQSSGGSAGGSTAGSPNGGNGGDAGRSSVCVPGSKRCEGLNVKLCDTTGLVETTTQTCLPSQSCSNGACVGTCVPNSSLCKDGAVWTCDASGTSTLALQCAPGLVCRVDSDVASCSTQVCTPGQPVCDGDVATTCSSDASGPTSGGLDCSKSNQACYGGQCRDIACSNGNKLCQHGDVYLCAHNGTDIALLTDCSSNEVCDSDMGSCRPKLCDPGKVSCDGTRIQTCNDFGSAWLPGAVECAADGKICVSGSCRKQVCGANRTYCQDGSLYSCDASGTTSTLTQTCNAQSEHCATYSSGSFGYCEKNACHAGDTVCVDNTLKVCNADGSLPDAGTACGDSQYCENAQCKDRPCVPGTYLCKGSDVYYCDFNSPFLYLNQTCDTGSACKALGTSGAVCSPLACTPSSNACLGNKIGTCAADGQSLSLVASDCTATSNVCTLDLKCAKSAADSVGLAESAEAVSASSVVGDVIDIDSSRKLTELQMQLVLAGPRELRWIVYELSGQAFVGKIDKVVSTPAGSGFMSSGALSFTLTAGKRYLLAVVVSGGDGVDYVDSSPFSAELSFGTVVGRVLNYYPGTFDAYSVDPNYVSQMKITTELP